MEAWIRLFIARLIWAVIDKTRLLLMLQPKAAMPQVPFYNSSPLRLTEDLFCSWKNERENERSRIRRQRLFSVWKSSLPCREDRSWDQRYILLLHSFFFIFSTCDLFLLMFFERPEATVSQGVLQVQDLWFNSQSEELWIQRWNTLLSTSS